MQLKIQGQEGLYHQISEDHHLIVDDYIKKLSDKIGYWLVNLIDYIEKSNAKINQKNFVHYEVIFDKDARGMLIADEGEEMEDILIRYPLYYTYPEKATIHFYRRGALLILSKIEN